MDSPRVARLVATSALALGLASLAVSCSSNKIPFFKRGGDGGNVAPTPAELAEERRQAAIDAAVISDGGKITKVKHFHLRPDKDYFAADQAIPFEARYHLHGAVTREDRYARYGNYYEVFWKTSTPGTPATVTFEYRQKSTGATSAAKAVTLESPKGRNITNFDVTGTEYWDSGSVTAWRLTVEQGGRTIAATQSFLWD